MRRLNLRKRVSMVSVPQVTLQQQGDLQERQKQAKAPQTLSGASCVYPSRGKRASSLPSGSMALGTLSGVALCMVVQQAWSSSFSSVRSELRSKLTM